MKKIVALLLVVGCLVTVLSLSVGAASGDKEIDFVVKTEGENITVAVETNFDCGGLQGALKYANADVTYNNVDLNEIASKNESEDSVEVVDGATKFAFVGDVVSGTRGKWATVSYRGDKAKFNISNLKVFAANGDAITDAKAYVVFRGDANTDGLLDIRDLVKLNSNTSDIAQVYKKNIDFDGDGTSVTNSDITGFRKHLLGVQ